MCDTPKGERAETRALMRRLDELFLKSPFYGVRQMVRHLRREGVRIGRRRAARLMRSRAAYTAAGPARCNRCPEPHSRHFPGDVRYSDGAPEGSHPAVRSAGPSRRSAPPPRGEDELVRVAQSTVPVADTATSRRVVPSCAVRPGSPHISPIRSFEWIHRSNLVGMGVLPLVFEDGQDAESPRLAPEHVFDVEVLVKGAKTVTVPDGSRTGSDARVRTDTPVEAAAFRRLVDHLRTPTDVQNIDLMNLAGFCRNCLSKWYRATADLTGSGNCLSGVEMSQGVLTLYGFDCIDDQREVD